MNTFIEVIEPSGKNKIFGCIYKHPNVSIEEFNDDFISPLLEKLSQENKDTMLMGDFNINLLNHNIDESTSNFIDTMYSAPFFPTINSPTRITTTLTNLLNYFSIKLTICLINTA